MTINLNGFIASAMYFMLGLISYLMIGDHSVFLWSDPWVYIYMVFWPIIWIWFAFLWIVALMIIGVGVFVAWSYWDDRHLRQAKKNRILVRQELDRRTKKSP